MARAKTTQELVADAAAKHGLTSQQILGHSRRRDIVRARWEAWRAARDQGWTLSKIASEFNRDHTSILHGLRHQLREGALTELRERLRAAREIATYSLDLSITNPDHPDFVSREELVDRIAAIRSHLD